MNNKIKKIDVKALKFRDELIKLCDKYNCEITSSCLDNLNMTLKITDEKEDWTSCYTVDSYNDYNLVQNDENYKSKYIIDEVIRKAFDSDSGEMAGLNNTKVYCGIITNDFNKASLKFSELKTKYPNEEIKYFKVHKNYIELRLINEKNYVWVKPVLSSRGYRCGKIIIDRNITLEELNEVIIPICYACGRDDVEIF